MHKRFLQQMLDVASTDDTADLQDQGVDLASNQVQYSLLYRAPERNGVLKVCQELGITLIAYSPLCQGLLTGQHVVSMHQQSLLMLMHDWDHVALAA